MIQLEVTTACNLNCSYCFRNGNAIRPMNISEEVVEKLAGCDRKYVLYGYGEPLLNKNLRRIAEKLGGRVVLSTNGINDVSGIAEVADRIGFSLDSIDQNYLSKVRRGSNAEKIVNNLKKVGEKAFIEAVVTEDSLGTLENLLNLAADFGIDLKLTNVVAPKKEVYEKTVYFEASKKLLELAEVDEDFIVKVIHDYSKGKGKFLEKYKEIHRRAEREGYLINLLYILESAKRVQKAMAAEKKVEKLKEMGKERGVKVDAPNFFGDAKQRTCPYEDSIFVRADGKVSSCMPFSRTHFEFVNGHYRKVGEFIVGDLNRQDYDEVVSALAEFERRRKDMSTFPWCADCPHVNGCWYVENNQDCYVNSPSCGECLYSSGIAKCAFD
ncbi:MAG: radical SAM protein [Archaeoglobus sp.]|nr:radical SAM protein [Archaeoglobus sp.]